MPNGRYDYKEITGTTTTTTYSYTRIISYTYNRIVSYTYPTISNYGYAKIVGYSRNYTSYTTNITTQVYDYVFRDGDYSTDTIDGKILVLGKARVYVSGDISLTGQESITITPGLATSPNRFTIYAAGANVKLTGNGVINQTGDAKNFYLYGLPTNKEIDISGNGTFAGVIYAPDAKLHMGGGGNNTQDFVGAAVVGSVKMNGHFKFHYDESLSKSGPASGFVISAWNEMPTPSQKGVSLLKVTTPPNDGTTTTTTTTSSTIQQ